jgi:thioredoxin reductase
MLLKKKVDEVTPNGVVVIDTENGAKESLVFDKLIIALGVTPIQDLLETLEGKVEELYFVGDCNQPRTMLEAVSEGFLVGYKI